MKAALAAALCSALALGQTESQAHVVAEIARAKAEAADGGYRICEDGESGAGCSMRPCASGVSFDGGYDDDCGNFINDVGGARALAAVDGGNPYREGRSLILSVGEAVPFGPALVLEETEAMRREWNAQRAIGELDALKQSKGDKLVSVPVLVAIIAGSLAVGAAVGAGAAVAAQGRR